VTAIAHSAVSAMPAWPLITVKSSAVSVSPARPFSSSASSPQWPIVVLVAYGAIVLLLLSRIAMGVLRANKAASTAIRVARGLVHDMDYPRPDIRESSDIAVPFTMGRRDPIIVLPKSWQEWDEF